MTYHRPQTPNRYSPLPSRCLAQVRRCCFSPVSAFLPIRTSKTYLPPGITLSSAPSHLNNYPANLRMSPILGSLHHHLLLLCQVAPSPTGPGSTSPSDTTGPNTAIIEVTIPIIAAIAVCILVGFCIRLASVRRPPACPPLYGGGQYSLAPVALRIIHDMEGNPTQWLGDPPEVGDEVTEPPSAYTPRWHGKVEGAGGPTVTSSVAAVAGLRVQDG